MTEMEGKLQFSESGQKYVHTDAKFAVQLVPPCKNANNKTVAAAAAHVITAITSIVAQSHITYALHLYSLKMLLLEQIFFLTNLHFMVKIRDFRYWNRAVGVIRGMRTRKTKATKNEKKSNNNNTEAGTTRRSRRNTASRMIGEKAQMAPENLVTIRVYMISILLFALFRHFT